MQIPAGLHDHLEGRWWIKAENQQQPLRNIHLGGLLSRRRCCGKYVLKIAYTASSEINRRNERSMGDGMEAAEYLLEKHGIISLPEEINHEGYELLLYRLTKGRELHPNKALRLFCRGDGGYSRDMLAVVDLIQADGDIDGMLAGAAISSAAVVWASCSRRFVYPNGRLGIHPVSKDSDAADVNGYRAQVAELEALDDLQCYIFAAASNKTPGWWETRLYAPGDLKWLRKLELIEIGMAKPVSERTR